MLQSLRHIKSRIRSIENTRKLTRAMEMISIAKLRRSDALFRSAQAYGARVEALVMRVIAGARQFNHPYFRQKPSEESLAVCVITSDTGMCSAYNNALIYTAEQFLKRYPSSRVTLMALGKKGFTYFRKKGYPVEHSYVGFNGRYSDELAAKLRTDMIKVFASGTAAQMYVVYARLKSASRYQPVAEKILPFSAVPGEASVDYLFEPDRYSVLNALIPVYLESKMRAVLMQAFTAEHQARALAMGEATRNATDLLEALILQRNKVRQANITREIIEIISSAEALKG